MQLTKDLLYQYATSIVGRPITKRLLKRVKHRASKGDYLAQCFLGQKGTRFMSKGMSQVDVKRQLDIWFRKHFGERHENDCNRVTSAEQVGGGDETPAV